MGNEKHQGGIKMTTETEEKKYLRVGEVAEILDVSESRAYKIMHQLNQELKKQGKIVTAGRISRKYLLERIYC